MIHRLPALQRQLLFAVVAALGLHGLFLWLLAGPARGVESVTPGHRLIVRVLKPAAIQLLSSPAGDPAVASRLPPRRFFPAAQQSAPVRSSSPSTEAAVPAPSKSASEQAATETAAQAPPLRLDSSVLRAAVASKQGHGSADGGGQWIRAAIQPSRRCCTTRSRGCPVRQAIVSRSQPNREPVITTADRAGGHDKSMQLIGQPPPNPSPHPKCYGGLCPLAPAGELKR